MKKTITNKTVARAAAILEEHFATLPSTKRKNARKELNKLSNAVSQRARGKALRVA
jgi:hypothetical protein